jgi:hypothetical protein
MHTIAMAFNLFARHGHSGKDSLIREVLKFNSRGVVVHSFKTQFSELEHDYCGGIIWFYQKKEVCGLTERIMKMSWSPECILNIL